MISGMEAPPSSAQASRPSFARLQWLFPIAVTLHNGEEALTMPGWVAQHAAKLPVHAPGTFPMRAALLVLTASAFLVTWMSSRGGKQSLGVYLLFGGMVTMLVNLVVPHLPATILFRGYTPGVITATLLNLPIMLLLLWRALVEQWVSGWKAVGFSVNVPLVIAGSILAWFHLTSLS